MKYDQRDEMSQGVVWSVQTRSYLSYLTPWCKQTTLTLDPKILYDLLVKFATLVYLFWYTYQLFYVQSVSQSVARLLLCVACLF